MILLGLINTLILQSEEKWIGRGPQLDQRLNFLMIFLVRLLMHFLFFIFLKSIYRGQIGIWKILASLCTFYFQSIWPKWKRGKVNMKTKIFLTIFWKIDENRSYTFPQRIFVKNCLKLTFSSPFWVPIKNRKSFPLTLFGLWNWSPKVDFIGNFLLLFLVYTNIVVLTRPRVRQ